MNVKVLTGCFIVGECLVWTKESVIREPGCLPELFQANYWRSDLVLAFYCKCKGGRNTLEKNKQKGTRTRWFEIFHLSRIQNMLQGQENVYWRESQGCGWEAWVRSLHSLCIKASASATPRAVWRLMDSLAQLREVRNKDVRLSRICL